jgi:hypothetical protein
MTFATYAHTDTILCEQTTRKILDDVPYLLSLIGQGRDERQAQGRAVDLATRITRLVTQRLPVTTASPLCWSEQTSEEDMFAEQVSIALTACLQQGFRRLLLVPWGGRQSTGSLLATARLALSTVLSEAVSQTEMALPHVHVDGVSARSTFEGLSSIQAQLSPLVEAFPGWNRTWIMLSAGKVKIVLLCSSTGMGQPAGTAAWEMPTMKALTAALCPHQVGFMTASERWRWQRDGQIYAHYLVSLLCAATQFLQQEQV